MCTINNIRRNALLSIYHAESGHPGGILSSIDNLTYLFMKEYTAESAQKHFRKKLEKHQNKQAKLKNAKIVNKQKWAGYRSNIENLINKES